MFPLSRLMRVGALALSLLLPSTAAAQSIYDTLSTTEKTYGVSLIWKEVSNNFVYFDKVPSLNWDSTYKATIPKALAAKNVYEYYQVIRRMMQLLKDGHTTVYTPQYFYKDLDAPPFSALTIGNQGYIIRVDKNIIATVPVGSEILTIDGKAWADFIKSRGELRGIKRSLVVLQLKTPQGTFTTHTFSRNINADRVELYPAREPNPDVVFKQLANQIAYVAINTFASDSVPIKFRQLLPRIRQAKALVIDIRRNGGGNSKNAEQVAQYLVDNAYVVGPAWRTRVQNAAYRALGSAIQYAKDDSLVLSRQDYYHDRVWQSYPPDTFRINTDVQKLSMPIAVLTSRSTFSAAEDFLIMLDGASRVTTIGQPTAGSSGQPFRFNLPAGLSGIVCAKRDTYPDGRDYIGTGIKPDLIIDRTITHYMENTDPELQSSIQLLLKKIQSR